jgi:hypothetical protein
VTTVHTPTAADLDAAFMMTNGNGRLCEAVYTADDTACPMDATHSVLFAFPEGHDCPIKNPVALCHDHTTETERCHAAQMVRCMNCRMPALNVAVVPLGGR